MTRPSGKSPSRSQLRRSHLGLDTVSLIDVSLEDDSLLKPLQNIHDEVQVSLSETVGQEVQISAKVLEETLPEKELPSPEATEEPVLKKKKKKTGVNLRKSLAWNNAFFTEEGVLDTEELSLVNKTFRKPPDMPKPASYRNVAYNSKIIKPAMIPKIELSSLSSSTVSGDNQKIHTSSSGSGSVLCSPRSSTGSITSKQLVNTGKVSVKHGVGTQSPRPQSTSAKQEKSFATARREVTDIQSTLARKHVENNLKKSSGSHFSGGPNSNRKDFAMKTDIGSPAARSAKVLQSHSQSLFDRSGKITKVTSSSNSRPSLLKSCTKDMFSNQVEQSIGGKSSSSSLTSTVNQGAKTGSFEGKVILSVSQSQEGTGINRPPPHFVSAKMNGSNSKNNPVPGDRTGTHMGSTRPSGLRMPSPKLGFFDTARVVSTQQQAATLRERTNNDAYDTAALLPTGRNTTLKSNAISGQLSAPTAHLDKSNQDLRTRGNIVPIAIPSAPHHVPCGIPPPPHICSSGNSLRSCTENHRPLKPPSPCNSTGGKPGSFCYSTKHVLQLQKNLQNLSPGGKRNANHQHVWRTAGQENVVPEQPQDFEVSSKTTGRPMKVSDKEEIELQDSETQGCEQINMAT